MSSCNTVVFGTMTSTVDSQNQIEFLQKLFGQSSTSSGMPTTGHIAQSVKIADGTMVKVLGIGSVKIIANLTLLNVLHVPTLTCNLLSVSKLTRDNHYAANFTSHSCSFQYLASGKMIGSAEECNGLYLLGPTIFPGQIEKQTQPIESPRQTLTSHDKSHETHNTSMMQTEAEIPRPSPANTENSNEDMNFPIALWKGVRAYSGNITLSHTPSHIQVADILTKSLCGTKFEELSAKVGMFNIMSTA
ncbi:Retrovirus-related Pol polyprotein from transposon RE1 [Senna tora]|uniref:Retrovirus-related Pol polyprotein from transposon RE1 n=1 Tax=Senna tora TaxID=362788 RepID=A0A834TYF2_9FABA|nr:Retrovirus-related Pol polyprotein from transposon RE1 [Senna tora]